jgi:hypothetical protein
MEIRRVRVRVETRCPGQTVAWWVDRQESRTEEEEDESCGHMAA